MEIEILQQKIDEIRGQRVMLDYDLAELYEVKTKSLNLAVKRNLNRFPIDFMFQITKDELVVLRFQIETSKGSGGARYLPYAFTEQGLAMLSGILNSDKAIEVNISIMRAFVIIRNLALSHAELTQKINEIELKYNKQFKDVYEALNYLISKDKQEIEQKERKRIGYK